MDIYVLKKNILSRGATSTDIEDTGRKEEEDGGGKKTMEEEEERSVNLSKIKRERAKWPPLGAAPLPTTHCFLNPKKRTFS
jgi:hypothetical protein